MTVCNTGEGEINNYDLYMEFLNSNKVVDGMMIMDITIPTGEPEKQYLSEYAFVDSDGDDFYEMHIRSERYYYIIDCENDELFVWKSLYPKTELFNNGDYLYTHISGAPLHHDYKYFRTDREGEDEWSVTYSWYDMNEDGKYDENDLYFTQGTEVLSHEEWKEVQKEYLCVGADKISWIMLTEKEIDYI